MRADDALREAAFAAAAPRLEDLDALAARDALEGLAALEVLEALVADREAAGFAFALAFAGAAFAVRAAGFAAGRDLPAMACLDEGLLEDAARAELIAASPANPATTTSAPSTPTSFIRLPPESG